MIAGHKWQIRLAGHYTVEKALFTQTDPNSYSITFEHLAIIMCIPEWH